MSTTDIAVPATPKIHAAIIAIMRAIGPIAKASRNEQQKYNFRGIDEVYNACHPHFAEHGVYATSEVIENQHLTSQSGKGQTVHHAVIRMRFTYHAEDGSSVSTEVVGEGMDYGGDKASNKAMSIADKYALLQLLKIPTAMIDGDKSQHQNPNADKTKPHQPARSDRVGADEIAQIVKLWKSNNAGVTLEHWTEFTNRVTGTDFNPTKPEKWTRDMFEAVVEAINQELMGDTPY